VNLLTDVKITKVADTTANGTTTVNGSVIDMQGFEGVLFVTNIASAAANNIMKVQQGQVSNLSDAADLAGSGQTSGASDEVVAVDIYKPLERYLRPVVVRGTTTVLGEIYAIQYRSRRKPQSNVISGTINSRVLVSPAEGTA